MTQWEQIKKEYKDTPIPANGPQQVSEAMAKAKQKRNRYKALMRYGTVAAAVLLVVLVVPRLFLFSGGAAKESADGFYMQDAAVEGFAPATGSAMPENGGENNTKAEAPATFPQTPEKAPASSYDSPADDSVPEADETDGGLVTDGAAFWAEKRDEISKEIISQMQLRMQKQKEVYYIRSEQYPNGFELLADNQSYYISKEGLLVIVFAAGEVAPAEQGRAEFIIPAEVFLP